MPYSHYLPPTIAIFISSCVPRQYLDGVTQAIFKDVSCEHLLDDESFGLVSVASSTCARLVGRHFNASIPLNWTTSATAVCSDQRLSLLPVNYDAVNSFVVAR